MNKAERIRQIARSSGKKVRPRDIIAALHDEGVSVSSAQVSATLRGWVIAAAADERESSAPGTRADIRQRTR